MMDFVMDTAVSREDFDWYFEEFDENNNTVYFEDSNGYWAKRTYDENNNQVYFENSNGYTEGTKPEELISEEEFMEKLDPKLNETVAINRKDLELILNTFESGIETNKLLLKALKVFLNG